MERQTRGNKHTSRWTDGKMDRQADRLWKDRMTEIQTGEQTDKQMDVWKDR